jgi:hypothetical protein
VAPRTTEHVLASLCDRQAASVMLYWAHPRDRRMP